MADSPTESACSLEEEARVDRVTWIRREVLPHVRTARNLDDGFAWECEASGREPLERWIALERACCEPIAFELLPRDDGSLRLEVRGDDPAVAVLASLVPSGD